MLNHLPINQSTINFNYLQYIAELQIFSHPQRSFLFFLSFIFFPDAGLTSWRKLRHPVCNHHVILNGITKRSPVDQVVRNRILFHHQPDLIRGQHPGPHVDLCQFTHKALADIKTPAEGILLLPQNDGRLVADPVPLFHSHPGEKISIVPKMDQPVPGVPRDADVLPSWNQPCGDREIPHVST